MQSVVARTCDICCLRGRVKQHLERERLARGWIGVRLPAIAPWNAIALDENQQRRARRGLARWTLHIYEAGKLACFGANSLQAGPLRATIEQLSGGAAAGEKNNRGECALKGIP